MADADFIPDANFIPDEPIASAQLAHSRAPSFIPDGAFQEDSEKYGTPGQNLLAGVEGAARGISLGASDIAEAKLPKYLPESVQQYLPTPESIKGRMEANPVASTVGNIGGSAALLGLTGGLGLAGEAAEGAGALSKIAQSALRTGAQGIPLGAGVVASDYALDDPNLNWQKAASIIGMSALFSAAMGGGLTAAGEAAPVVGEKISSVSKAAQRLFGKAGDVVEAAATPAEESLEGSLGEMVKRQKEAAYEGVKTAPPEAEELNDALSRYEMKNPVNEFQKDALVSRPSMDAYQTAKTKGPAADILQGDEALQKSELLNNTASDIRNLAGKENDVTSDAVQGGDVASDYFSKAYQAERKAAGELVGQAKALNTQGIDHSIGVVDAITKSMPELTKMIDRSADGISVKPYSTSMGFTKQTYGAVKEAVNALQENPEDFQALFNIRKGLSNGVNMFTADKSTIGEISNLRSTMMDYMQKAVENTNMRDAFRRYAINEVNGNVMKKAFGIDIGDSYENVLNNIRNAPEKIADKIFRNTESVSAAKNMLPKEQFDHVLANWLSENMDSLRKGTSGIGEFSGTKWNSWLKKNQDVLGTAFNDKPQLLQKLNDASTIMRILPDHAPINPSGTAKTAELLNEIKEHFGETRGPGDLALKLASFIKNKTYGKLQNEVELKNLNAKLAGREASYTLGEHLGDMIKKVSGRIDGKAKAIFKNTGNVGLATIPSAVRGKEAKSNARR